MYKTRNYSKFRSFVKLLEIKLKERWEEMQLQLHCHHRVALHVSLLKHLPAVLDTTQNKGPHIAQNIRGFVAVTCLRVD